MQCVDLVAEPGNKLALAGAEHFLTLIHTDHRRNYRSGVSSIFKLKRTLFTYPRCHYFEAFSPFFEYFQKITEELAAGGFYNYWIDFYLNRRGLKLKIDEIGPQILTMEHLLIGFQIIFGALMISLIAFGFEIGMKCVRNTKKSKPKSQKSRVKQIKVQTKRRVI